MEGASQQFLPRGKHLVAAASLAALDGDFLLFEVGFGTLPAFLDLHIPGAAYLDTSAFEAPPLWNKVSDDALVAELLLHGIRHDTTVILHGRNQLAAARVAHLMLYAGVQDVRLLDGGYAAWRALGLPGASGPGPVVPPASDFGVTVPAHPMYLVDLAAAQGLQRTAPHALVSVRTWNEFIGRTSGYPYIAERGEIAGALWGRTLVDDDVNSMSELHHLDGTMAPAAILQIWTAAGLAPHQRTVFYCGTGWRASLTFFYAWLMGWDDIAVFDGGWYEWSRDAANPVICRTDAADAFRHVA